MSKVFTKDEVAAHKSKDDMYIVVDDDVYNLTEFQSEHPGGQKSRIPSNHVQALYKYRTAG